MKRLLCFLTVLGLAAGAHAQSFIPSGRISADDEATFNAIDPGGTSTVRTVLRWIDTYWPTNIDIHTAYVAGTNLYLDGLAAGLASHTNMEALLALKLDGTNIQHGTLSNNTWNLTSDAFELVDVIILKYSLTDGDSGAVSYEGGGSSLLFSPWATGAVSVISSGVGLLAVTNTYSVHAPAGYLARVDGFGLAGARGTNASSVSLRVRDALAGGSDNLLPAVFAGFYRRDAWSQAAGLRTQIESGGSVYWAVPDDRPASFQPGVNWMSQATNGYGGQALWRTMSVSLYRYPTR